MFYQPHIDFLELPCDRLAPAFDGLVILHLSDMHLTKWNRRLQLWRRALTPLKPHLLLITGDLGHRSWLWKTSLANIQRLLEPLAPPLGTFFILGNHDSAKLGPALAQTHDKAGHPRIMLQNQTVFLTPTSHGIATQLASTDPKKSPARNHLVTLSPCHPVTSPTPHSPPPPAPLAASPRRPVAASSSLADSPIRRFADSPPPPPSPRLALIGIHQHRRIDTDIPFAMSSVLPSDFKLMMLHYPDLVHPAIAAGADICLAGHTHGGQICWPDGQPLFRQDTLPREMSPASTASTTPG